MTDPATAAELEKANVRLSVSLLKTTPGSCNFFQTDLDRKALTPGPGNMITPEDLNGRLNELLTHLQQRLVMGLAEAWLSSPPNGYGEATELTTATDALSTATDAADAATKLEAALTPTSRWATWNQDDERWARTFTETFVFSPYGGPSMEYYDSQDNSGIYSYFSMTGSYPIVAACQQLSTFGVLSRGIDAPMVGGGFGCSVLTLQTPVFVGHNKTLDPNTGGNVADMFAAGTELNGDTGLTPGSVIVFNPKGSAGKGEQGTGERTFHIGSVLRAGSSMVQFIDTGVLGDGKNTESGTVDQSYVPGWDTAVTNPKSSLVGFGILPAPTGLADWTKKLAAGAPLGFVRCIVLDTTTKDSPIVRYVSKLAHMTYPYSRLIWSVRRLPVERLSVLWYAYNPKGGLANTLFSYFGLPSVPALPGLTAAIPQALSALPLPTLNAPGASLVNPLALMTAGPAALLSSGSGSLKLQMVIRGVCAGDMADIYEDSDVEFWRRATVFENGESVGKWFPRSGDGIPDDNFKGLKNLCRKLKLPNPKNPNQQITLEEFCADRTLADREYVGDAVPSGQPAKGKFLPNLTDPPVSRGSYFDGPPFPSL